MNPADTRCSECGAIIPKTALKAHQRAAHPLPGINRGQVVRTNPELQRMRRTLTGTGICKGCGAAGTLDGDYCITCMGKE
jgi:hypothetical protein